MKEQEKVLIVDDLPVNVELLETLLVKFDFLILKAYSGKEAIELAKKEQPNLVLLDIMMPDMDGWQVCESLRKDDSLAATAIIMVTAKDKDNDIVQSLEKGADDYIIKPVDKVDLFKKVSNLLAKAKSDELPSQFYLNKLKNKEKEDKNKG